MSLYDIPYMLFPISAGFPSPAMDYIEKTIDICEFLIAKPNATFILRVQGDSMKDAKIFDGDFVVVEKSKNPKLGDIVIAEIDGNFVCKELCRDSKGNIFLRAHNEKYADIYPEPGEGLQVWGVVVGRFNKV